MTATLSESEKMERAFRLIQICNPNSEPLVTTDQLFPINVDSLSDNETLPENEVRSQEAVFYGCGMCCESFSSSELYLQHVQNHPKLLRDDASFSQDGNTNLKKSAKRSFDRSAKFSRLLSRHLHSDPGEKSDFRSWRSSSCCKSRTSSKLLSSYLYKTKLVNGRALWYTFKESLTRSYMCAICGKKTGRKKYLYHHLRKHGNYEYVRKAKNREQSDLGNGCVCKNDNSAEPFLLCQCEHHHVQNKTVNDVALLTEKLALW